MLDTEENIKQTAKEWENLLVESGITDEMVMSHDYDYLDDEDEKGN